MLVNRVSETCGTVCLCPGNPARGQCNDALGYASVFSIAACKWSWAGDVVTTKEPLKYVDVY